MAVIIHFLLVFLLFSFKAFGAGDDEITPDLGTTVKLATKILDETREVARAPSQVSCVQPSQDRENLIRMVNNCLGMKQHDFQLQRHFAREMRKFLAEVGETIVPSEVDGYDFIIIGGGVIGTTAAIDLGSKFKVLVIDSKIETSSFAPSEFFLNTGRINENMPLIINREKMNRKYISPQVDVDAYQGLDPAYKVVDYLTFNLFSSGADVILGHQVMKLGAGNQVFPIKVTLDNRKVYFAKRMIEALGPGKPTNPFPGIDPKHGTPALFEDDFLTMAKNGELQDFIKEDDQMAIIGGNDGSVTAVNVLLGLSPTVRSVPLKKIFWVGRKGPMTFAIEERLNGLKAAGSAVPELIIIGENAKSVMSTSTSSSAQGPSCSIELENGQQSLQGINKVVLCLGRKGSALPREDRNWSGQLESLTTNMPYVRGLEMYTLILRTKSQIIDEILPQVQPSDQADRNFLPQNKLNFLFDHCLPAPSQLPPPPRPPSL